MEEYYKIFYMEDKVLKCTRYGYDDEYEATKVADMYSQKDNVTNVEIYKYKVTSDLVKKY